MGKNLYENKEFALAQKFLLHGNDTETSKKLIEDWSLMGEEYEKDLFPARFILL